LRLVVCFLVYAQVANQAEGADLAMQAKVISKEYCRGPVNGAPERIGSDPNRHRLLMRLHFSFQSTTIEPVILSTTNYISRVFVSANSRDAEAGKYLSVINSGIGPVATSDVPSISSPEPYFRVVPGTEGVLKFFDTVILIDLERSPSIGEGMSYLGKKVALQFEVDHPRYPTAVTDELALLWKGYGELWVGPIKSDPLELFIPKKPPISPCFGEFGPK